MILEPGFSLDSIVNVNDSLIDYNLDYTQCQSIADIKEFEILNHLLLFPNPASDLVSVSGSRCIKK